MHDVIIVGAGVAGPYLASLLPEFDVILLEKERKITIKDSGIVSKKFREFVNDRRVIKDRISCMELVSANRKIVVEKDFSYLLERKKFSHFLRKLKKPRYEKAEKVEIVDEGVLVTTDKGCHEAQLVVGADGANSLVRRELGIRDPELFLGMLVKTKKKIKKNISVYFNKYYSPEFFSWIVPKNEYGLITNIRPREYLQYFKDSMGLPGGRIYAAQIPIGYTKSFSNRALLVGDSCGQVKPVTGGGIVFSLTAARHAADTIRNAFARQRFDRQVLGKYEDAWKKDFGFEIRKQLWLRKLYRKLTNKDIDDFFDCVKDVPDFDYDHLTDAFWRMPKRKLIGFAAKRVPAVI